MSYETQCPFCKSEVLTVWHDDDYVDYNHYVFDCGTRYSHYYGWTNSPAFGRRCRLWKRDFKAKDHHMSYEKIKVLYNAAKEQYRKKDKLDKARKDGEIIKIEVRFANSYRTYAYEAPKGVEVGDTVKVHSPHSGKTKARVVKIGSSYKGPIKMAEV